MKRLSGYTVRLIKYKGEKMITKTFEEGVKDNAKME